MAALTTSRDAFPAVDRKRIVRLTIPALLLTGERTLPIHQLVNDELERLLPNARRERIRNAGHEMWVEQPQACLQATLRFLGEQR